MGGSLLHVKNREFFFDHTSKDTTRYDSPRRSLYLPVVRNNLYDVFQLFDLHRRHRAQRRPGHDHGGAAGLFAMNSELMTSAGERLAETLLAQRGLDDRRAGAAAPRQSVRSAGDRG